MFNFFHHLRFLEFFYYQFYSLHLSFLSSLQFSQPFIFNNSRVQLVESLYLQAQSINKLIPEYDEVINFDEYADNLAIQDMNYNELRVTIIDNNWNVIGDSLVDSQDLYLLEKHSPDTRVEIQEALNNTYGSTSRRSESTGLDLIYVAIQRDPNDIKQGLLRVALPFDIWESFFNFFIYPFLGLIFISYCFV